MGVCLERSPELVLALLGMPASSQSPSEDAFAKGMRQVREADYAGAISSLDTAIREMSKDPARAKDLGRARPGAGSTSRCRVPRRVRASA